MKFTTMTSATAAMIVSAGAASAACGIESGSVRILSNDFAALHAVADFAAKCESDGVEVTRNATEEHKSIQVPALTIDPATYTVAVIATNSIVPLLNNNLIRPLDDYIAEYGEQLQPSQLIKVGGETMAIAFMANAQHLVYREDLLAENDIAVPTDYDELLAAAETLRANGVMEYPIASNFMPGWNIAAEFVNAYLSTGADFFEPGTAELAIQNEHGMEVLETLKAMTEYMNPEWVTYDSNSVLPIYEAGDIAFSITWGSRAGAYLDEEGPAPAIAANSGVAAALAVGDSDIPGAALWWDGFTIASNISDEDAEASFQAMMNGVSPEMMAEHPTEAVWLIEGYEPTEAAEGVIANLQGGARPYPMLPYMGLLHTALGDNLTEYLQGDESAEQALADVAAAYETAAREAGFLN
ncbi:extracellular solute-binding protein [Psychromarinibacter sp. C21-152]|uniref:Extracellular solute-binding protein n=1 Tax=Psychromarinibacter sediminicola TaxID=3033385 RepID=A0AAE3T6C7_9RHOB|nr:extracellular solute-binding protein [Psychromarinibacter sediminicola]MDF0599107.1 extracellular solute-binding protein [Psychromarinibacter sediminicola]